MQYQTIEYQVQHTKPVSPPAYVFLLDTCINEEELSACRAAITKALQTLPEWAHVGLVTYGTHVHVHELGFSECAKSYVFQVALPFQHPNSCSGFLPGRRGPWQSAQSSWTAPQQRDSLCEI